jgi:hypothetical protein
VGPPPPLPDAHALATGVYRAYLPAADAAGRAVTLELRASGEAQLTTFIVGKGDPISERGTWSADASGVRAQLGDAAPLTWAQHRLRLDPVSWDERVYGATGLPLLRWLPSRAPRPGCAWQPVTDPRLGLRLLAESCVPATPLEIAAAVEIFEKPEGAPIEAALEARFVAALSGAERDRCAVRVAKGVDLGDPTKLTFEIAPTRPRGAALDAAPCGPHGARRGTAYFEYHPAESRTRVLFVHRGAFDERSIELLW